MKRRSCAVDLTVGSKEEVQLLVLLAIEEVQLTLECLPFQIRLLLHIFFNLCSCLPCNFSVQF